MREATEVLQSALQRDDGGIAVVWCPDLGLRDWLVSEVDSLAPTGARPLRTDSVAEAIAAEDRMALLVPIDETEAVLDLDGSRDKVIAESRMRKYPLVLFLVRNGDGARALAEKAPSLSSWIGGSDADPEDIANIDIQAERQRFAERTGQTPDAWLAAWRAGGISRTGDKYALAYFAMLLEGAERA